MGATGIRSALQVFCVETHAVRKWHMTNPLAYPELKSQKPVYMKHPEGVKKECLVFKSTQHIPDGLPYFCLESFSEHSCSLEDVFVDRSEAYHEGHASLTHQHLLSESLEERIVRMTGIPRLLTWDEFMDKVTHAQTAMKEKEADVKRQMDLAQHGQAAETTVEVLQSATRFRRRTNGPLAMAAPVALQPAPGTRHRGRGSSGAGAAQHGSTNAIATSAWVAVAPPALVAFSGGSVVGSICTSSLESKPAGKIVGGLVASACESAAAGPVGIIDMRDKKLRQLLTSKHGKLFPTIMEILQGVKINRQLYGDWILADLLASDVGSYFQFQFTIWWVWLGG